MARPLRIEYPGAVYHTTSRGNERRPVFMDDPSGESIWGDVRAQSILGGDDFVRGLSDYVGRFRDIPEIAKSQGRRGTER